MKAISFSLYGGDPKFCVGAAKNIFLARHWFPDWTCVIWTDNSVPSEVLDYLKGAGAMVIDVGTTELDGLFWRFLINDMPDVERFVIRDTDSRINGREKAAVDEWIRSGLPFHVMRDHPHHKTEVMGGTWGAVAGLLPNMAREIATWDGVKKGYDSDQQFLKRVIWPKVKDKALQHDTCWRHHFPNSEPFPTPLSYNNLRFVGEVFDENDQPRPYAWEQLFNYVE